MVAKSVFGEHGNDTDEEAHPVGLDDQTLQFETRRSEDRCLGRLH